MQATDTHPKIDFAAFLKTGRVNLHNIPEWQHQLVFALADWLSEDGGGKREFTLAEGGSGPAERLAAAQRIIFFAWEVVPMLKIRRGNLSGANFVQLHSPEHSFWVSVPGKPVSNAGGIAVPEFSNN